MVCSCAAKDDGANFVTVIFYRTALASCEGDFPAFMLEIFLCHAFVFFAAFVMDIPRVSLEDRKISFFKRNSIFSLYLGPPTDPRGLRSFIIIVS